MVMSKKRSIVVSCIDECEYDAWNKLVVAGRRLYFRTRKEFPMLQRKLSIYRFVRTK